MSQMAFSGRLDGCISDCSIKWHLSTMVCRSYSILIPSINMQTTFYVLDSLENVHSEVISPCRSGCC